MELPSSGIPRHVESELWRVANKTILSSSTSGQIGIADFEHFARLALNWAKARPRQVHRGDVVAFLEDFARGQGVYDRCGAEQVQLAIEVTVVDVFEEDETSDPRLPEFSDDALSQIFSDRHKDDLRYVAKWSQWFMWNGKCWREDSTLHVWEMAKEICREAAASIEDGWSIKKALLSRKTIAAIEHLSKSDRRLAATVDQWDADQWRLNTPGAVVDLRTGKSEPPSPYDYMTKVTAVLPSGDCPAWRNFLDEITCGDLELIRFIQRVLGYSLTGSIKEHALFFGVFCKSSG
jgi:phage/plasmid-associated DNA primase